MVGSLSSILEEAAPPPDYPASGMHTEGNLIMTDLKKTDEQ
jgi:hypothetical protein